MNDFITHTNVLCIAFFIVQVMDQKWYQDFVSDDNLGSSNDMLFDLLTAANFMGIKELLDLSCLNTWSTWGSL